MPKAPGIECCVCDEEFKKKQTITCYKCDVVTCKSCAKEYIEMTGTDACCMNEGCDALWSRKFLTQNFGTSYVNGKYKKMIDKNRVDRVIATNSQFMEDAIRYKKTVELKKKYREINAERDILLQERLSVYTKWQEVRANVDPSDETCIQLKKRLEDLRTTLRVNYNKLSKVSEELAISEENFLQRKTTNGDGGAKGEFYQQACPLEECKGFLSKKGVCGVCHVHVCSQCKIIKGTEEEIESHVCKKEDIESVKAILKETKPCPRCDTRIHKINGCDQMWCPYCQEKYGEGTTFSWRTGKIERGRIHNPHYIDYMRNHTKNLREVGDVHCGGLPEIWQFDRKLQSVPYGSYQGQVSIETRLRAMNILRRVDEINQYIVNPLREKLREQNIHRMTQIKHIIGEIDDTKFRKNIAKTEKKREKEQEILDIFEVVVAVLTEKINHLYNKPNDMNVVMFISFVEEFIKEENRCLAEISYLYNQTVNIVDVDKNTPYHPPHSKIRMTSKKDLQKYCSGESWQTIIDMTNV